MSKRHLDTENKENEQPNSAKKAKIIDDQNIQKPESLINDENIQKSESEMADESNEKSESEMDDESMEKSESEIEEKEALPIAAVIENSNGRIHPTNNQYYIYENTQPTMVSNTARFWSRKYLKVLRNINPDLYGMYIHNDFVSYGELEVIENCLVDIAKGIFLKRQHEMRFAHYITSFRRLEALTIILDITDNFPGIDDGERFMDIVRVIGACYVTILRDLLPKSMFNNEELNKDEMRKLFRIAHQLPNFKEVIKRALIIGYRYLTMGDEFSGYTNILQIIYCNWLLVIEKHRIDLNDKKEDIWKELKHASEISDDDYDESFDFMKELGLYSINNPGLGGNSHDLSKWSKSKRSLYSFDNNNNDDDSDENFWFHL